MGFAHLVPWVLLVSIPCKGAWPLICGTSEVSLLPVWFGLVLLVSPGSKRRTCWRKASPIPTLNNLVNTMQGAVAICWLVLLGSWLTRLGF